MAETGKKEEAMLYYLYMMSDGEVSYSEEKLFNELCRDLGLNEEDKQSVITKVLELVEKHKATFNSINTMMEMSGKKVGENRYNPNYVQNHCIMEVIMTDDFIEKIGTCFLPGIGLWYDDIKNPSSLARVVWNLINLGYADTCYSDEEKTIVNYLVKKWNVNQEVYQEMIDTSDVMFALTKHKDWVISTFPKGTDRDKKEKKLDSDIEKMLNDIKITIEELTM